MGFFKIFQGTRSEVNAQPHEDGKLLYENDQDEFNQLYADLPNGNRIKIGGRTEVVDDLATKENNKALSANQGNILGNKVGELEGVKYLTQERYDNLGDIVRTDNITYFVIDQFVDTVVQFETSKKKAIVIIEGEEGGNTKLTRCGLNLFQVTRDKYDTLSPEVSIDEHTLKITARGVYGNMFSKPFQPIVGKDVVWGYRVEKNTTDYSLLLIGGDTSQIKEPSKKMPNPKVGDFIYSSTQPVSSGNKPYMSRDFLDETAKSGDFWVSPMLTIGSTVHPYEPYNGQDFTVPYNTPVEVTLLDGVNTFFTPNGDLITVEPI